MSKDIFASIPEYVRITILAQVKKLMSTRFFSSDDDREDIIQDLLLFYIEQFYKKPIPSEAYVVASLKNQAMYLIKAKVQKHFGLFLSLDELGNNGFTREDDSVENLEQTLALACAFKSLTDTDKKIIEMILADKSLDNIAATVHVSKSTIYKLFEKIRKKIKK